MANFHYSICDYSRAREGEFEASAVEVDEFVDTQRCLELLTFALGVYDVVFVDSHFRDLIHRFEGLIRGALSLARLFTRQKDDYPAVVLEDHSCHYFLFWESRMRFFYI
jgi:hypothetical protein